MTSEERALLIERYATGPQAMRDAFATAPKEILTWRPSSDAWSIHEIICHCADSEMGGALRIRMIVAEPNPRIIGYDQDAWAHIFDYHNRPTELAFAVIDTVRGWTSALIPTLTEEQWAKTGTHSESGAYSATDWLHTYGNHLHEHVDQINANIDAWNRQSRT